MPNSFITDTDVVVPAITTEQMTEVDRIAIEETGPNLYQMMENAGRNLAEVTLQEMGNRWSTARVMVLAGPGGNGGGGICAARHLSNRGIDVRLCLAAPDKLGPVPSWQLHIFRETAGVEVSPEDLPKLEAGVILDALIGYGLRGVPTGGIATLIRWANSSEAPVISLDVPSGVNSNTGDAAADFIRAKTTVTLALPKTGLQPGRTGHLVLADIGIPRETYRRTGVQYTPPFGARFRVPLRVYEN